ncbi:hypothetical protein JANAI62_17620 [Jannaschia pagri]|uniref:Uncharacterized protein n=1 Tax=Jannaschia pagri TaxID=2829797 RepID=A0ABQ4NL51_9RHOB|nr:hypothetical protein JANAI61_17640 [Jannaschia sp. AI_61]GIT95139.1 hypothetical protein JANAI62_17620 [Jannaschia sp. AI_62]
MHSMMKPDAPMSETAALSFVTALGIAGVVASIMLAGLFGVPAAENRLIQFAWLLLLLAGTCGGFVLMSECTQQRWLLLKPVVRIKRLLRHNPRAAMALPISFGLPLSFISTEWLVYLSLLPGCALITVVLMERYGRKHPQ